MSATFALAALRLILPPAVCGAPPPESPPPHARAERARRASTVQVSATRSGPLRSYLGRGALRRPPPRRAAACAASSSASSSGASSRRREPERRRGQPVGEPGVLGQQRAVQVGADHRAVRRRRGRPRSRRAPSLPWPLSTRPSGCAPAPRCVRPPWFSKPASTRGPPSRSTSIATLPISRGPSSRTVSRSTSPTPGQPLAAELVAVAEQLVAAADGEDRPRRARRRRAARRA